MKEVFIVEGTSIHEAFSTLKTAKTFCRDNFDSEFPWDLSITKLTLRTSYIKQQKQDASPAYNRFRA